MQSVELNKQQLLPIKYILVVMIVSYLILENCFVYFLLCMQNIFHQ